ncbi:MAG TPA: response regulator [Bryobacteraceae bacterium]|nr:response regulator [Bryobacteraceae bacterium]
MNPSDNIEKTGGRSVLVVDDSRAMRAFIRRLFRLSGLPVGECLEAENGAEALQVLRQHRVDLILTDVNMPVMSGAEFIRELRQDPALRPIPVLVVSTDATEKRINEMVSLGALGYLRKPFFPELLKAEIERMVAWNV